MRQQIHIITLLILISLTGFLTGDRPGSNTTYTFKTYVDEVGIEVERARTEVLVHLLIRNISQYDHILIERSAESPNYFGMCKYISCSDTPTKDGNLLAIDRYPYPAVKDVYYRIKTVDKDGVERAYPAVLLPAVTQ